MGNQPSRHKISAQDKAILDMKIQRDKLHQYQKKITIITDREKAIAKECLARGDKSKALLALRRKKYQESLLEKTDAQLEQLENLTSSVEFAAIQRDVLFGLEQGTSVLKEIHREMGGLEKVEQLLEETEEARAYQREISEMLSGQMSNEDEDEVEDELEALEQEINGTKLPTMPEAPGSELQNPIQDEAAELTEAEREKQKVEARRQRAKERAREQRNTAEPILA
ncbi:MAG: Vacuolar protein sorting-associated protein 20 [Cirrosporium novae-zelandiae]|nr:MAG: Vacuolar protein sorting-associated protein 20 [Cirrosporium novae-zelandiae]